MNTHLRVQHSPKILFYHTTCVEMSGLGTPKDDIFYHTNLCTVMLSFTIQLVTSNVFSTRAVSSPTIQLVTKNVFSTHAVCSPTIQFVAKNVFSTAQCVVLLYDLCPGMLEHD